MLGQIDQEKVLIKCGKIFEIRQTGKKLWHFETWFNNSYSFYWGCILTQLCLSDRQTIIGKGMWNKHSDFFIFFIWHIKITSAWWIQVALTFIFKQSKHFDNILINNYIIIIFYSHNRQFMHIVIDNRRNWVNLIFFRNFLCREIVYNTVVPQHTELTQIFLEPQGRGA